MPEVLHALGLSGNPNEAQFVIEKNGRRQTVALKSTGQPEMMPADTDVTWMAKEGWVDLRDQASAPLPLWLKDPQNKFWFEYLPDTKTVYAQINQVGDKEQETLAAFSERLFTFINANPVEKMILDLRLNRGGNGELLHPGHWPHQIKSISRETVRHHGPQHLVSRAVPAQPWALDERHLRRRAIRLEQYYGDSRESLCLQRHHRARFNLLLAGLVSVGFSAMDRAASDC
jgi:hypothetical protein